MDRPERRRQEKEAAEAAKGKEAAKPKVKAECTQCDEGPCDIAPRVFTECPVCGCPTRFTVEAMKGDFHLEDIMGKQPALFSHEYLYDTPNESIKLVVIGDSCARCGALFTLARDKKRSNRVLLSSRPGGDKKLFLP